MSLLAAVRYMERVKVTTVTLTPDDTSPEFVTVTTDRDIRPGAASVLRSRVQMAVLEHRRALSEPASVLTEEWTLERRDTGAWILGHKSCRLLSLPRWSAGEVA